MVNRSVSSTLPLLRHAAVLIVVSGLVACAGLGNQKGEISHEPENIQPQPPIRSNLFLLPPPDTNIVGQLQVVIARKEDTLADIAQRYNLGYDQVTRANPGVDPWLPEEGARIVLPTQFVLPDAPREGIVVNIPAMRLFYYPETAEGEPKMVVTHPIGVGRSNWPTPVGQASVISKAVDPTWYVPASIRAEHAEAGDPLPTVVPPGPDNPLGRFALGLDMPGYLIHGTNKAYGIGMRVSHGCVRLYPEDIEALFAQVSVGTSVSIVNQPYLVGSLNGTTYLETHARLEEDDTAAVTYHRQLIDTLTRAPQQPGVPIDWKRVALLVKTARAYPVPVSQGSPGPQSLVDTARLVDDSVPTSDDSDSEVAATAPSQESEGSREPAELQGLAPVTDKSQNL
jgi:L,D-transpeptidase ErfK/SrfK